MKRVRALVLVLLIAGCSFIVTYRLSHTSQTPETEASPPTSDQQCDATLWQYVYHPARLEVLGDPCISVTGSVEKIRKEAESQLRSYRKKMDKAIFEQTVQNFIARRLREINNIPRMSLFYL